MRVTVNRATNTAHIRLTEYEDGDVARWRGLADHEIGGEFVFEFDKGGRLLGIEVKFAAEGLPPDFLDDAEREP
ncbi:MAG TPA: DUF2283 domain-containing protein [Gaiellaceae bacterium]|jgi:hypothetical protein